MFLSAHQLEFNRQFPDDYSCLAYLSALKWKNGYSCHRCGCNTYSKGYRPFDCRCKSCDYNESVRANTMFHKVKFGIHKAFHIVFRLTSKKGISTYEIARTYGINQKSAWLFKCKVQKAILDSTQPVLENEVEVDEFMVGGVDKNPQGRSKGDKKVAFIAVEKIKQSKVGNLRMTKLESFSKDEILENIDKTIYSKAGIVADKFSTYQSIEKSRKNLSTKYSKEGQNFLKLYKVIMNFKSWLEEYTIKCLIIIFLSI